MASMEVSEAMKGLSRSGFRTWGKSEARSIAYTYRLAGKDLP
jgi:hypothetical protein